MCYLQAKITPEHKIKSKCYRLSCIINEKEKKVVEVQCNDCPASEGGCKHGVAFLMWIHRRSEEPSPTEKVCYWKRSVLTGATTAKKYITTKDFGATVAVLSDDNLLKTYISEAKKRKVKNSTMRYHQTENYNCISLHILKLNFLLENLEHNAKNFITFCKQQMNEEILKNIEKNTRNQSTCSLWLEMRYGRVTASKAHDSAKCGTFDGVLVENILGAKVFQTEAMKRGLYLEEAVLKELSRKTDKKFQKAGLFLSSDYPILGASPDAINEEVVVEIKCPSSDKTFYNFIDCNGNIKMKYFYQIQLQMHLTKRCKGIFVVAKPDFETSKEIMCKYYDYDTDFVVKM